MTNYCAIAQTVIRTSKAPYPNIELGIVEHPEIPGWVFLVLYARNLAEFSDDQIHSIRDWLQSLLDKLNNHPLVQAAYSWQISYEEK